MSILDNTNQTLDPEVNQIIFDTQQWLASEFDWPFLFARWDVQIPAGTRYNNFPTTDDVGKPCTIDFQRAGDLKTFVKWNNVWQEVDYRIREMEEFNYIDSDLGSVLDPIQRWMFDDQTQFEVWPIPASNAVFRFTGQRSLNEIRQTPFTIPLAWNDNATLDLDDMMVTYFAAAEYMIRQDATTLGKELLAAAQRRMQQVRMTYPKIESPPCIVGGGSTLDRRAMRIVPMIVVGPH